MEYQIQYKTLTAYREIIQYDNLPKGREKDFVKETKEGFKLARAV